MINVPGEMSGAITHGPTHDDILRRMHELSVPLGEEPIVEMAEPRRFTTPVSDQPYVGLDDFNNFVNDPETEISPTAGLGMRAYAGYMTLSWRMWRGDVTRITLPEPVFDIQVDKDSSSVKAILDIMPRIGADTLGEVAARLTEYNKRNPKPGVSRAIGPGIGITSVLLWKGVAERALEVDSSR